MKRTAALGAMVLLLATTLTACARPGDGGYLVRVDFRRAVALYEQSRVKVMGIDVGRVTKIRVSGDHVSVEMRIDRQVPLPVDVNATIVPFSLIGERNIVLSPPYRPGQPRLRDGTLIPPSRTHVPVEPDEALQAVTDLARAIDPNSVKDLFANGATALRGQGGVLNEALRQSSDLMSLLASQDQALLAVAENVHRLAGVLVARQQQLGRLLDDFSTATGVLASERDALARFLSALVRLSDEGKALLTDYRVQLPKDLASLATVSATVEANADSVQELLKAVDEIGRGVVRAYDPVGGGVRVRIVTTGTAAAAIQPLFDLLGLGPAPCTPLPGLACP